MTPTDAQKWMLVYSKVVSDAWLDKNLETALVSNPKETLREKYNFDFKNINILFNRVNHSSIKKYDIADFDIFTNSSPNTIFTYELIQAPDCEISLQKDLSPIHDVKKGITCCCCCL